MDYLKLKKENEKLKKENEELKKEIINIKLYLEEIKKNNYDPIDKYFIDENKI
jgi:cell division protein FtsB